MATPHQIPKPSPEQSSSSSTLLLDSMFGALNRFIAHLDADPNERRPGTHGAFGFQVLRNANPEIPLEPWFDFIIGINGRTIVRDLHTLYAT